MAQHLAIDTARNNLAIVVRRGRAHAEADQREWGGESGHAEGESGPAEDPSRGAVSSKVRVIRHKANVRCIPVQKHPPPDGRGVSAGGTRQPSNYVPTAV